VGSTESFWNSCFGLESKNKTYLLVTYQRLILEQEKIFFFKIEEPVVTAFQSG
jgi:hypothetical protein